MEPNWTLRLLRLPFEGLPWWGTLLTVAVSCGVCIAFALAAGAANNKNQTVRANTIFALFFALLFVLACGLPAAFWPEISTFFSERSYLLLGPAFQALSAVTAPHTAYVIWMLPLVLVAISSTGSRTPRMLILIPLVIALIIDLGFLCLYLVDVALTNPLSILYVGLVVGMRRAFDVTRVQKQYDFSTAISGILLKFGKDDKSGDDDLVSMLVIMCIISAFFFGIEVSREVQISYYGSLLSGLLAIVGFIALIFTFTFEMLSSVTYRRAIAADTKRSQAAISALIGLSIVGLFVADNPITFDLRELDAGSFLPLTIFSLSVVGGAFAIQYTIIFFHRIVDFVVNSSGLKSSPDSLIYHFAEMNTVAEDSSISNGPNGLSQMRAHIEEGGNRAYSIERTSSRTALRRLRNAVIVLPKIRKPLDQELVEQLQHFVDRGNILIVLTDQFDADYKKDLLGASGIQVLPIPSELVAIKSVPLEVHGTLAMDEIGHFRALLDDVVPLGVTNPAVPGTANDKAATANQPSMILFAVAMFGRGAMLAIGGVSQWTNKGIGSGDNILFLDYLQAVVRRIKDPTKPPLVEREQIAVPPVTH